MRSNTPLVQTLSRLEPDVAAAFSTEEAVNEALLFVLKKKDKEE